MQKLGQQGGKDLFGHANIENARIGRTMSEDSHPLVISYSYRVADSTLFVTPGAEIEISGYSDVLERILPWFNGVNSLGEIAYHVSSDFNIARLRELIAILEDYHIIIDASQYFSVFNYYSSNPQGSVFFRGQRWVSPRLPYAMPKCASLESISIEPLPTGLSAVLARRRSSRSFANSATLPFELFSGLVWATCGATSDHMSLGTLAPRLTIPSAGGLRCLQQYVIVAQRVENLETGLYCFDEYDNTLHRLDVDFTWSELDRVFHHSVLDALRSCLLIQVLVGRTERVVGKYGNRGYRYMLLEAGHAAQNAYVFCAEHSLKVFECGGFYDREMARLLELEPGSELPLTSLIVGG